MTLPTFTPPRPPSPGTDTTPEVKILKADFGDGYSQEGGDGMNNVRAVVQLQWDVLTATEAAAIYAFFKARKGYERFWYTLSGDPAPTKFSCPDFSRSRSHPNTVKATFREQFDIAD